MQNLQHEINYLSVCLSVIGQRDLLHNAIRATGPFGRYIISGIPLYVERTSSSAIVGKTRFDVSRSRASVKSLIETKSVYLDEDRATDLKSIFFRPQQRGIYLQIETLKDSKYKFFISHDFTEVQAYINTPSRQYYLNLSKLDKRFIEYHTTTLEKGVPDPDSDDLIPADCWSCTSDDLKYVYGKAAAKLNMEYSALVEKYNPHTTECNKGELL